jgi:Xaa-Pro aminopeptidase
MAKVFSSSQLERLRALFKSRQDRVDGIIIDDLIDLYYLTGLSLSLGRLIIKKNGPKLFVDTRYFELCQKKSPIPVALRDEAASFGKGIKQLAFDSSATTVDQYQHLEKLFPKKMVAAPHLLKRQRAIKDKEEIAKLEKSARVAWRGFKHICKMLAVGVREKDLALEFKLFCLQHGASDLAFETIIAFGENGAMPHYRPGDRKLERGDLVLIDFGVVVDHYASDMTRTVEFGKVDRQLLHMQKVAFDAFLAALAVCRPGTKVKEIDLAARKVMRRAKMEHLFLHSLGHGIGLETHEFPSIRYNGADKDETLKEGMVFTIEPGLYLPKVGGVRYENTVVVTKQGCRCLIA